MNKTDYINLQKFLLKCNYNEEQLEYIYKNFGKKDVLCILRQIYASLGMINDEENEYLKIFEYLLKKFNLGCNILEVACGNYPVLAHYIDTYQKKIGKGTITVIDPEVSIKKLGNIKIIKDSFNYGDNVDNFDLIISQSPCLKIDDVAVTAIEKKKQFFISMCKCIYSRYPDLVDFFYDDCDFDPLHNRLLSEMRQINKNDKGFIIDSDQICINYTDIKCFTGKKLIKK